jgi:hypothetical protein
MGHKPRIDDPPKTQTIDLCTEKELLQELGRRGYECTEFKGRTKKSMMFLQGEIRPMTKFILHVPEGKYPAEEK